MPGKYFFTALSAFFIAGMLIWLALPAPGVPILAYHQVHDDEELYTINEADFAEQMYYLQENGYTAVSLADMFAAWAGEKPLPAKPVIITFDDGYADNLLAAQPIMEKYGMKGTMFIIGSFVGQPDYLTWEQIRELKSRGAEIGSHTMTHAALNEIPRSEQESEVRLSRQVLEEHLGVPVEYLAYPYGQYDSALPEILHQAGYRGACTGIAGLNAPGDNAYLLKRINIPRPRYGMGEFRLRLLRADIYAKLGITPRLTP